MFSEFASEWRLMKGKLPHFSSIDNEDWRECEKSLKEFLEQERAKMKERSLRISQPYSSDPQDIQNIVRARWGLYMLI